MNEEDPEFEKTLRAINHYYITQVGICTAALSKLRSAELSDKNIIIRAIMCDMPDCGVETEASADDCGVDLWADRAEYVNETSFNLYVTQAEENVLWNAGEKGRKPGRLAVPQQRITVRSDGMGTAPVIPLIYLTLLSAKLLAMAFPDGCTDAELSGYNDERTMAALTDRVMTVLEQLALRDGEEETRSPALNTSNAWEGKGDAARSLEALKQYIRLKDSIDEKVHSAEVLNIRKLWRYEQLKTQNAALQSQKQHCERIVYETILICAALMLLGAWLGLRMWHRAKLREFAQQKRILRQENELDAMRRKEEHLRTTFFRQLNSRFIAQVRQGGESRKCRMSDEDWKTIFTHADAVFDNFTVRLRGQFPALNEEDIRYCCMVRMHLSQAEIASVVCLEKDSVKKRLKRIRTEKLASAKGSTLEEILSRL